MKVWYRDFKRGWFPMGARDATPQGAARRMQGVHPVKTTKLQSRWGSTLLRADCDAHTVHKFNGVRYAGLDDGTYINIADGTVIQAGLDGTRLTGVRMPPTIGKRDWWFVAGGSLSFKIDPDTGLASQWGIDQPPNGFQAALVTRETRTIDMMEAAAGWTAVACTLTDEGTIKQEGTNSMQMDVAASATGTASKAIAVDLSKYASNAVSPDQDFIEVWLRVDHPERVQLIQVALDLSGGSFNTDFYVRTIVVNARLSASGLGNLSQFEGEDAEPDIFSIDSSLAQQAIQEALGTIIIPPSADTWTKLRMPKSVFFKAGANDALTWANVVAVRLLIQTNDQGAVTAYWDAMQLGGGVGMQGNYKYKVTFGNSASGSESNPNSAPVAVTGNQRQAIDLTNLPLSTDPQVDRRVIYRTVGGGVLFFRVGAVEDNTSTTFRDTAADFAGLDGQTENLMESVQVNEDADVPSGSWDDAFGPVAGCMFWGRSGNTGEKGRVFFSPPGRPESGGGGFIDLTGDDDPVQRGVIWNGTPWVFTLGKFFQITGAFPAFAFREVYGVPGTAWPNSVVATPIGIVYLAFDGVRVFTGASSKLLHQDAVNLIFRGEVLEDVGFAE